ncbi:ATP-binding protein [Actinokineospora terrae]|uniref:Anti-sigma regulatory factor (Ser/Thr protein kinase) n=1 Tax=Actinokineospora terrae TaxID=155974 RepID=A0A1H9MJ18_9PSEU|nr:ATP-binding protein [Actinokineospora terrae]SER23541.1 Anti-sigma regulatory factor (Ser/Thr protein kinase) [Actinokineospora terrae]
MLRIEILARAEDVAVVRAALRAWLTVRRVAAEVVDAILIGVGEAVANAVEHAYLGTAPGPVIVCAHELNTVAGTRNLRFTVTDHGRWREPTDHPTERLSVRGRGLVLLRALSDAVRVDRSACTTGTTVVADFRTPAAQDQVVDHA